MDHSHFSKNYSFLDDKREEEIALLAKKVKKTKSAEKKERMQLELRQMRQQHNERKLSANVSSKLSQLQKEEREKVKQGIKKPFHLKNSAKRQIMAEEKFAQLKTMGKVNKYLQRKERQQQAEVRKNLPAARRDYDN